MLRRRSDGPRYLEQTQHSLRPSIAKSPPKPQHIQSHMEGTPKGPVQLAQRIAEELRPHLKKWTYIDSEKWDSFDITCYPEQIDLSCESDNGAGFGFLRLITSEKMQTIAHQNAFDTVRELYPDLTHPFHNSQLTLDCLERRLWSLNDKSEYLFSQMDWDVEGPEDWENQFLQYFPHDGAWKLNRYLRAKNYRSSHTNCILTEARELQEDTLMFSEVWCILLLTVLFFRNFPGSEHKVVPVTIATISGTTFRIVQGFADSESGTVKIRKSRIINLGLDRDTEEEGMRLMVRWLLAEPVQPNQP